MKLKRTLVLTVVLMALLSTALAVPASGTEPPPAAEYDPCINLEKTGPETAMPGETITYHFWVENCGDLPLVGGYRVWDPLFGSEPIWDSDLDPGMIEEFDKVYTLPEECDPFVNHAWAIGKPLRPDGGYEPDERDDSSWTVDIICEPDRCETELIAGQHYDAGHVEVWDDGSNLYVKYIADGWTIDDTHLYVGATPPTKAAPGKFPYFGQTEYTVSGLGCGDIVYIAAHAVVSMDGQSETAWADTYGTLIREKGWAMYFGYELCSGCFKP